MTEKKNRRIIIAALAGIMSLSSCKPDKGSAPIAHDKFVRILADVHMAQALVARQQGIAEKKLDKNACYKDVLDTHGVTMAEFDSTVSWYARNAQDFKTLYQEVIDTLEARREKIR